MKQSLNNQVMVLLVIYMTLAIDVVEGHGLSIKAYCGFLPKKTLLAVHLTIEGINQLYTTNKFITGVLEFKCACVAMFLSDESLLV